MDPLRKFLEKAKASERYYKEIMERKFRIFTDRGIPEDKFKLYHDLRREQQSVDGEKVDAIRAAKKHILMNHASFISQMETEFSWLSGKWDEVFGSERGR